MANEVQPQNGATTAALATVPASGDVLSPFAATSVAGFELAQRMAKALASSTLVPQQYRDNPANCMIAMEYAARLRVSVLALMQNLAIIQGKPSLSSMFLIATVNASGRFSPLRFEWQGEPGQDSWACRAHAKERGGETCHGTWITWLMAKKEGWATRNGTKWQTMPEQMFQYRAAAFWTRIFCPELSLGFHTSEEIQDMLATTAPAAVALPEQLTPASAQSLEAVLGLQQSAAYVVDVEPVLEPTAEQNDSEQAALPLEQRAKGKRA